MAKRMDVDFSLIEGLEFRCLDGCALCCVCQSELDEEEYDLYNKNKHLRSGLTNISIDGTKSSKPTYLKLQGKHGGCFFLKNRRCTIYEYRPRYCRQFPYRFHALLQIQVMLNRGCRGVKSLKNDWKNSKVEGEVKNGACADGYSNKVIEEAISLLEAVPRRRLEYAKKKAMAQYEKFMKKAKESGIFHEDSEIRDFASKLMEYIEAEEDILRIVFFTSLEDIEDELGRCREADELICKVKSIGTVSHSSFSALEQFAEEGVDTSLMPFYSSPDLGWQTYRVEGNSLLLYILHEDGRLDKLHAYPLDELRLIPFDSGGREVYLNYGRELSKRESFRGYIYHICDREGYDLDLLFYYLGVFGETMLDLWWRTSLLAKNLNKDVIDMNCAEEGIVAFDLDCMDSPTIGVFI